MAYILVADDEENERTLVAMELKVLGHEVALACDGQDAVEQAAARRPDLVVLDVMMPRMDGFDACRAIRALPGCEHIPVVTLTGLDDTFGINEVRQAGFDALLFKPWKVKVLQAKVTALLEAHAEEHATASG